MFEYTALHWGTFIAAAALLILSPGPTMANPELLQWRAVCASITSHKNMTEVH
jgi:hypothetical protein